MTNALEDHEGIVRTITNLRFADDIDGLAGEEGELVKLVERLDKASTAYTMETSAEKTKSMTNNISGVNKEIKVNGQKLETVTSFKYRGSVLSDEGSKRQILSRTAQTTAALCAPLSHPSSCMLVNHEPLQQSFKEEYKAWKRGLPQNTRHLTQRPCY